VVNQYFTKFPWRLPVNEEPIDASVNPTPAVAEELTEEEEREKGEIIAKMKKVRGLPFVDF